ncbi:kinase, partial [Sandarakinorhabdus sp.]|uniref:kinase n=1 Tax=Sandarakinorhabdus sp. TaxID=1916663 RepID=UPI00286E47BD
MDALPLILDWLTPKLGTTPLIIGLAGAQGSGKSTLAARLAARLPGCIAPLPAAGGGALAAGGIVAAVSLDDFYLTRARRQALAAHVHPLFATRGVPGTHDVPLLLDTLLRVRSGRPVSLPVFDKLADDRLPPQHWRRFNRIDILILEGWCIGARPQPAALLAKPVNALEATEDPHALWRTHVNQALAGNYQRAWAMLDALAFLAAPDWETVPRWRAEQEAALTRATGRHGMDPAALTRFCAHYERLTRWQLADTP